MTGDNTPSTSTSHPSVVSVSDPDYLLIQHQRCVTSQLLGRAAWIYLQQLCTNLCEFDVYKLAADLFDIEQKPGESPLDFFTRMNTACLNLSNFVDDKDFVSLWMASKAGLSDEKARFVFNGATFPRGVDHYVLQDKLTPFMKTPGAHNAMVASTSGDHGRSFIPRCYKCGELGHIRPRCTLRVDKDGKPDDGHRGKKENQKSKNNGKPQGGHVSSLADLPKGDDDPYNVVGEALNWLFDTAATVHIVADRVAFRNYRPYHSHVTGLVATGEVIGIGDVDIDILDDLGHVVISTTLRTYCMSHPRKRI
jgi:hypothetical protein